MLKNIRKRYLREQTKSLKSLPIFIERDEDGFIVAECPIFDGCYSQGKTIDEALANLKEVILLVLEEPDQLERFLEYQPLESGVYSLPIQI